MPIRKQTRSLRGKVKSTDHVFQTEGREFDEALIEKIGTETVELGYDPHSVTKKIMDYGMMLTGIPLYRYQRDAAYRIIYSVVAFEGETLTLLWARQSGKSETMAFIITTLTTILPALARIIPEMDQWKDGFHIGLFAPQSDQVVTTYNRAMTRIGSANAAMVLADPDIDTALMYEARYGLSNGSTLTGQTASRSSKIESKTYDLVICEEAQELDDLKVQKSIEPMVTATGGTILKVGTTGTRKSDFLSEIRRNEKRNRKQPDKRLLYHLEYDYKEIIRQKREQYDIDGKRFHLNYEKIIGRQLEKRGADAEAFKLSYALMWQLETGMFMTDKDWLRITNRRKNFKHGLEGDESFIVAGLDIAKEYASTVLTIASVEYTNGPIPNKEILKFIEITGMSYAEQIKTLVSWLDHYEVDRLVADYTGVGKAVIDMLVYEAGSWLEIIPYTFTRASKSDMWVALRDDIEQGRLTIPANKSARMTEEYKNCEEQMKGLLKFYAGSYLVAEKAEGNFDDYPDSIGLMTVGANMFIEDQMEIEIEDKNPFYNQAGVFERINNASW